jgi:CO dehydrogenase maturation factor
LLGSVITDQTVIADLEAGIGTLTRLPDDAIDVVVVVVEPTPRSLDVGVRARDLAVERRVGRVVVVANRVEDDADRDRITALFGGGEIVLIPEDPGVARAEREGRSAMDVADDGPAVQILSDLAGRLLDGRAVPG